MTGRGAPAGLPVAVLVGSAAPAPAGLEDWQHAVGGGDVHVAGGSEELRSLLEGLPDDATVLVAEAATTPGPALVERLEMRRSSADVVDARVLPLDVTPGPEADVEQEVAAATRGSVPLRTSGVCILVTAGVAARLAEVLGAPGATSGPDLAAAVHALGLTLAVEATAAVVRHSAADVGAGGAPEGAAGAHRPGRPATSHPALMEATALHRLLRANGLVVQAPDDDAVPRPFLSVLTRTQGLRRHGLEDVLACLAAQDDRDFEWVLACHRAAPEQRAVVSDVVALAPDWLRQRVRLIEVDRPGRAAPLNDGFASAAGRYVAVLDDDDVVTSNWVSAFHALEGDAAGRVLRCGTVRQSVTALHVDGNAVAVAVGNPRPDWPIEFDLLDQMRHNNTPFMSAAIPRGVFHSLGIRFDESLATTEDWDFLVRAAGVVGVSGAATTTSVYRWWLGGETSRAVHTEQEWDAARNQVLDGFARLHVVLTGQDAAHLQEELSAAERRIAELEASQHEVILQLDRTAREHQKTVDNWRASEARAEELKKRIGTLRARTTRRLELIRGIEELLRLPGMERPDVDVYTLTPKELERLLRRLVEQSGRPTSRSRRPWGSR